MELDEIEKNLRHLMTHRSKLDSCGFADLIGQILSPIPSLGWELGPSPLDEGVDILTLSAQGDKKILSELIDNSSFPIQTRNWEIVIGVPPRAWERFFLVDLNGEEVGIDASKWQYKAKWSNGFLDLALAGQELSEARGELQKDLIEIVLNGELGELNVAFYLSSIQVVKNPMAGEWKNIEKLRKEFIEQVENCYHREHLVTQ